MQSANEFNTAIVWIPINRKGVFKLEFVMQELARELLKNFKFIQRRLPKIRIFLLPGK